MSKRSIYESYLRIQLEAIVLTIIAITLSIGCLLWSYQIYREKTRVTYLHNQGVTLQILEDAKINGNVK